VGTCLAKVIRISSHTTTLSETEALHSGLEKMMFMLFHIREILRTSIADMMSM